ncbi:MAG: iron-siderophore ABC transporter substrate-binding protein [Ilumatobacter fluminis]|uniref:iron-siderophore ABC transporter substrate-binding protein n=1 Tax=Ilumatobacter fluminis TaxID=467091 RepID=UPI0032EC25A1
MNTRTSRTRRVVRSLAVLTIAGLVVAACGSDDDADDADEPTTTEVDVAETTDAPDDTPATTAAADDDTADASDDEATETTDSDDTADDAAAFPVTIEHKYGETTIDAEPERVVSVGFAEHDGILALGVTPVGVRDWYGDMPYATWPWAQDELGDAQPEVIAATELNFEQIAAMDPDVILGIGSGMTDTDYETLAAIAPTIAQPGEFPDYGTPWRDQLLVTGEALGRTAEAEQIIADIEASYEQVREQYPEFEGQTAAVAFTFEELPGAYSSNDIRSQMLMEFGFEIPAEFDELAGDAFYFNVSQEEVDVLDTDVIVWVVSNEAGYEAVRSMPLRPTLNIYAEGREVVADPLLSGAFSHASPLSIPFVIDELVPELALAVDGDPSTVVPSAELLVDGATSGDGELGDDEQAAADAWAVVFDSAASFDDKQPHLEDAEALRSTVEAYAATGDTMGGIALDPTVVQIDGTDAIVTYDVLFGGSAAYTALEGEIADVDGVWQVSRDEFCDFMALARTPCPAG